MRFTCPESLETGTGEYGEMSASNHDVTDRSQQTKTGVMTDDEKDRSG